MIEEPRIAELPATATAFIHLEIPREQMPEVIGPAVEELMGTISGQGREVTGAMFAHHLDMQPGKFVFELGFPVSGPVSASGRVEPGQRSVVKVAQTVYQGPYEGLPDAWGEFHGWLDRQGLNWASDIWECYVTGPESSDDPSAWRTELNRPLKD